MQFRHESGKYIINGIIEVDDADIPVKVILKWGEIRLIYKDPKGYWFKYRTKKFRCDERKITNEKNYVKIHIGQCLKCARLQPETNRCQNPSGDRSFKGHTRQNCRYFKEQRHE
jgi:hypothetical protein